MSDTQSSATIPRAVVVVDRGWIFAGDIKRSGGRIHLSNALLVFRWKNVGFDALIADPHAVRADADLRPIADLDIPEASEVFTVPVPAGWGLEPPLFPRQATAVSNFTETEMPTKFHPVGRGYGKGGGYGSGDGDGYGTPHLRRG